MTEFCNLKEVRDQLLGLRCSNGQLFMFGVSNEGRLGTSLDEQKGKDQKGGDKKDGGQQGKDPKAPENSDLRIERLQHVVFPYDLDGDTSQSSSLIDCNINDPIKVQKVECGSSFTLVLTQNGWLYSWGFGKSGSLGLGERSQTGTPRRIVNTFKSDEKCVDMVDISCGSSHSLAIDRHGSPFSWGNGQGGRLGHNSEVGENQPRKIEALEGKFIKFIEAGDASSACISHDSNVYTWGSGLNGRLGNGTKHNLLLPEMSQELKKKQVQSITKGTNTTFAIFECRKVFGWGSSKNGKLGFDLPQGKNYELPREIISLTGHEIYQIAAGPFHTLCLTSAGKILSMGNSKDGKLGLQLQEGTVVDVELPQVIKCSHITFFKQKV